MHEYAHEAAERGLRVYHRSHVNNPDESTGDNAGLSLLHLVLKHEALAMLYRLNIEDLTEGSMVTGVFLNCSRLNA